MFKLESITTEHLGFVGNMHGGNTYLFKANLHIFRLNGLNKGT